ncbi:MAG: hypothetical protein K2H60_06170 [Muribaculaceae bacterium]|nr:hypothetical protein [Muribaculaceae bacterium]
MKTSFLNTILKSATLIVVFTMATFKASASDSEAPKDMLVTNLATATASPVIVTAADLVTKVYGALPLTDSKEETIQNSCKQLNLLPESDENELWLDSDTGYCVSYSGMTPQVSAVAQFDDNALSSFGYFFIFPYTTDCREEANRSQCAFCSSLLQEMYDMGSIVGVPVDEDTTSDLFSALGSYDGHHINVSLREQSLSEGAGRFLLVLEVTPNTYNLYDSVMAMQP